MLKSFLFYFFYFAIYCQTLDLFVSQYLPLNRKEKNVFALILMRKIGKHLWSGYEIS